MAVSAAGLYKDIDKGYLPYTLGSVTLVGGAQVETLTEEQAQKHTANAKPIFSRRAVNGGTPGHLSGIWNRAARTITWASSEALDVSIIDYMLVG